MPIRACSSCGVVAPSATARCTCCGKGADTRRTVADRHDGAFWVAIRATFQCRTCSFRSPLDGIEPTGVETCRNCGLRQRLDPTVWQAGAHFAHACGDLASHFAKENGPLIAEGRAPHPYVFVGDNNRFARVGVSETFATLDIEELSEERIPRSLHLEAGPGHPTCGRCQTLLVVEETPRTPTQTRCPSCGDAARFGLPHELQTSLPTVLAVVSDDHRVDRPAARTLIEGHEGRETMVVRCGACGGNVAPLAGSRFVHCGFCGAYSRIPTELLTGTNAGGSAPNPAIWWLLFQGPSPARRKLEEPVVRAPKPAQAKGAGDLSALLGKLSTEPGVSLEEIPAKSGPNWLQLLLGLVLPAIALALAWVVLRELNI